MKFWLASQNCCWAADRLAKHGLQHPPVCCLCSKEEESLQYLLIDFVFSRITWHEVKSWCRLPPPIPDVQTTFFDWWLEWPAVAPPQQRKGFASLVIITAWFIWKHRNAAIFDGLQPSNSHLLSTIKDEAMRWARDGVKGLDRIIPVT